MISSPSRPSRIIPSPPAHGTGTNDHRDRSGAGGRCPRRCALPEGARPGRFRGAAGPSSTTGGARNGPLDRGHPGSASRHRDDPSPRGSVGVAEKAAGRSDASGLARHRAGCRTRTVSIHKFGGSASGIPSSRRTALPAAFGRLASPAPGRFAARECGGTPIAGRACRKPCCGRCRTGRTGAAGPGNAPHPVTK